MGAYANYQTAPVASGGLSPPFLSQPNGVALETGLGQMKDALADRAKLGVSARAALLSPPDGLIDLGVERQVVRGPSETDAQYAQRLVNAWTTWPYAGTAYGLLTATTALGYSLTLNPVRGNSYTLTAGVLVPTAQSNGYLIDVNSVPPSVVAWAPSTPYLLHAQAFPVAANGYFYSATNAGTSGSSAPAWPSGIGALSIISQTGSGTVAASGVTKATLSLQVKITTAGEAGGAAQFAVSLNGGTTFSTQSYSIPASGVPVVLQEAIGVAITFTNGTPTSFALGDTFQWALTIPIGQTVNDNGITWCCYGTDFWSRYDVLFNSLPTSWGGTPPAYSSDEVTRLRTVIKAWQPAYATCNRIIIPLTGRRWGSFTWGAGNGNWGGTTTVWSPV